MLYCNLKGKKTDVHKIPVLFNAAVTVINFVECIYPWIHCSIMNEKVYIGTGCVPYISDKG